MADRLTSRRSAQVDALQEMLEWLTDRPCLPLPVHGSWAMAGAGDDGGEDGDAFHIFVSSPYELDLLSREFDQAEEAPRHPRYLNGVRRRFGPISYDVLLDDDPIWHSVRPFDNPPAQVRSARLAGMLEMVDWLRGREELRLPLHGAHPWDDDTLIFDGWAGSAAERDRLAQEFDRLDPLHELPRYVNRPGRDFSGGIRYEVRLDD